MLNKVKRASRRASVKLSGAIFGSLPPKDFWAWLKHIEYELDEDKEWELKLSEEDATKIWQEHTGDKKMLNLEKEEEKNMFDGLMVSAATKLTDKFCEVMKKDIEKWKSTVRQKTYDEEYGQLRKALVDHFTGKSSEAYFLRACKVAGSTPLTKTKFVETIAEGVMLGRQHEGGVRWLNFNKYRPEPSESSEEKKGAGTESKTDASQAFLSQKKAAAQVMMKNAAMEEQAAAAKQKRKEQADAAPAPREADGPSKQDGHEAADSPAFELSAPHEES